MESRNPFAVPSMVEFALSELIGQAIELYLVKGVKLTGTLLAYDHVSLLLGWKYSRQIVMRHAISTISLGAPPQTNNRERGQEERES